MIKWFTEKIYLRKERKQKNRRLVGINKNKVRVVMLYKAEGLRLLHEYNEIHRLISDHKDAIIAYARSEKPEFNMGRYY